MFILVACGNSNDEFEMRYHDLEKNIDYSPYFMGNNGSTFLVYKEETKIYSDDSELVYKIDLITKDVSKDAYCKSEVMNVYNIVKDVIKTTLIYNH